MINPWNEINQPSKDVAARRVNSDHPLDLFWARDYQGHYLFIYEFLSEDSISKASLPNLVGIRTFFVPTHNTSEKARLILVLNEQSNWEIFMSLCNDLIQATWLVNNSLMAVGVILSRLERWQEFLKKNKSGLLGEEKIVGLIGELLFMKNYLIPVFGAGQSVIFWQGPEGLPQDFNVNESAIEVKCQLGATSPFVKISSADQLCPQLPEMYLMVFTLGKSMPDAPNVINLPKLISQIADNLKSASSDKIERFYDHLHQLGYFDSDGYLDFNYVLVGAKTFQVVDGFPRVCSNELHRGVSNLSYSISLSECAPFEKQPDWMMQ